MTNQTTDNVEGWEAALVRDLDALGAAERAAAPAGMEARIVALTPGVAVADNAAPQNLGGSGFQLAGLRSDDAPAESGALTFAARRGTHAAWSLRAAAAIALFAGIGAALIAARGPVGMQGGAEVARALDADVSQDMDLLALLFDDDAQSELMAVSEEAAAISGRLGGWGESWLEGDAL